MSAAIERGTPVRRLSIAETEAIDALVDARTCSDALTEAKAGHARMPHDIDRAIDVQARERYLADALKRSRANIREVK